MEIDWTTVAFEVLNFGVLVVLLQRFLFRPIRRTLDERREQLESTLHQVQEREAAAAAKHQDYEQRAAQLEQQAEQVLEAAIAQGRTQAEQLISEGRAHVRTMMATAEHQLAGAQRHALEQLRTEVLALARDAAARVVRHMDAPSIAQAYARRAAHGFAEQFTDDLPDLVQTEIGDDVDPDAIVAELRTVLGPGPRFEITTDPSIVAGVRLRAHGHEVEASVTDSLRRWYAERIGPGADAEAAQ